MAASYKKAGVDIEAGYEVVSRIGKHIKTTNRLGVMGTVGSFGGLFDISALKLKEPVLASGTDSVGSKIKIAVEMGKHDTVGIDVVAMCVNDIITQGAEPLYFLDYIGCGKVIPAVIEDIVKGVCEGCRQAGCALVGGETAEIAGLYAEDEYDLAGFAVGAVEKAEVITGEHIKAGDVIIGLPSDGVHSNGFSLIRKIIKDSKLSLDKVYGEMSRPLGEVILTPTKIYVKDILNLMKAVKLKGIAHITGGGFIENIPRILPSGLGVSINKNSWEVPEIFGFLSDQGNVPDLEMFNIFNMGIGMVLAVSPEDAEKAADDAVVLGKVTENEGVHFE